MLQMSILMIHKLRIALSRDLNISGSKPLAIVVDDAVRKIFTANKDGAILEFAHKQTDNSFWNGTKYYGSGKRNKIRFQRTKEVAG